MGKKIMIAGIITILFFSNQFIANLTMNAWEAEMKPIADLPNYEMGIVLTGMTNLSKTVYDRTLFNKGADRATHALQLYKMGKIKKLLITGGQGINPTNPNKEAELIRDFWVMAGVPEEDILVENLAKNTYQNAIFSKNLLSEIGHDWNSNEKFLLITSAFHMKRAKACFDKAAIPTDTFPVDYYGEDMQWSIPELLYPNPNALLLWHKLFKEWIGLITYKVTGYI